MDPKQTFCVPDLTSTTPFSIAGHGQPTGPLCPGRPSYTVKRKNVFRAPSKLTREAKNDCPRERRAHAPPKEDELNRAHHSFVGSLRLFWD